MLSCNIVVATQDFFDGSNSLPEQLGIFFTDVPVDQRTYRNGLDCLIKTVRAEGVLGFYKGFIPNWLRLGPHTVISFFLFESLRKTAGINPI